MRTLTTLILLISLAACQAPEPALTEAERAEIESTLLSAQSDVFEACSTLDLDTCFAAWDEDGLVVYPDGLVYDLESAKRGWAEWAAGNRYQRWIDRNSNVTVYSPTMAMVTTSLNYFVVDTLGVQSDTMAYAGSFLWMKKAGDWKQVYLHEHMRPIQ